MSRYDGKTWTTYTTQDGLAHNGVRAVLQDREGHFWFGTRGGGVSRYDDKTWTTFTTQDGLGHNAVRGIVQDQEGHFWFGTWGGVSRYNPRVKPWTSFSASSSGAGTLGQAGQPAWTTFSVHNDVWTIEQDREGHLWVGAGDGVSRYDGQAWTTFTAQDGLAYDQLTSIVQDRAGYLWFATAHGVSRYDPRVKPGAGSSAGSPSAGTSGRTGQPAWITFTQEDGLAHNVVWSILQDREGNLWCGTRGGGVSRYDGQTWTNFTEADGLAYNHLNTIFQDQEGHLWFGTGDSGGHGRGVSRYDGQTFTTFSKKEGLAADWVHAIFQDQEGNLWFGTQGGGASRYDGQTFTTFTAEDGLAHGGTVYSILQDRKGHLWFATAGGVSRYDGKTFTTLTSQDGLAKNDVRSIAQGQEGHLWFGTGGGGASRYDGQVFQTLDRRDGLPSNHIRSVLADRQGNVWFGTSGGVTRFRPPERVLPPVFIDAVVADRRYVGVSELALPSTAGLVVFEFGTISHKTRPKAMVYRYRLVGYDDKWRTTRARRVEYHDLPRGSYTFEVQAVDRDLVYSGTPATVALTVHLPYERMGLLSALGIAVVLVAWQTVRVIRRDRRLITTNEALSDANNQLKEANEEIRQQTERKSAFLASMSHELRTPMNAIKGFTNLVLRRERTLSDRGEENLQKVDRASDHLLTMINDLLDLSKIEAGRMDVNPERFDVRELVASACDTVSPLIQEGVDLRQDVADPSASSGQAGLMANTDKARLQQMVINLLSNAIKFTDSGTVTVTARSEKAEVRRQK